MVGFCIIIMTQAKDQQNSNHDHPHPQPPALTNPNGSSANPHPQSEDVVQRLSSQLAAELESLDTTSPSDNNIPSILASLDAAELLADSIDSRLDLLLNNLGSLTSDLEHQSCRPESAQDQVAQKHSSDSQTDHSKPRDGES